MEQDIYLYMIRAMGKHALRVFAVVIPKDGLAMPTKRIGGRGPANPSFGITPTTREYNL